MAGRFRILHMGDLHYPCRKPGVDWKRSLLAPRLVRLANTDPLRFALLNLPAALRRDGEAPQMALFAGDVTDGGEHAGMISGCKYLVDLWGAISSEEGWATPVVGNHDVARGDEDKFAAARSAWRDNAHDVPIEAPLRRKIQLSERSSLVVCHLNSCLACGEHGIFPEPVGSRVKALLADKSLSPGDRRSLFEFVDVPLVSTEDIEGIPQWADAASLFVVHAHHNLLPQPTPRFDYCPELVTAGRLRRVLATLDKPVLYLHGHVHDHLVEVVRDPEYTHSVLVTVCCPEFPDGVSVLDIFTGVGDSPVSVQIRHWELASDSYSYRTKTKRTVCLVPPVARRQHLSQKATEILHKYAGRGQEMSRMGEICDTLGDEAGAVRTLAPEVELLERLEYVRVLNPDEHVDSWIVNWRF